MPKLSPEVKEAIARAVLRWAICKHFNLLPSDPLPSPASVSADDIEAIRELVSTVRTIDDFLAITYVSPD